MLSRRHPGPGGAERQLFYILRALSESGAEVRLLSLTQGEFWQEKIEALGVKVIWVGQSQSKARRLSCIFREVRHFGPTIIQSQHFFTNLYASVTARLLSVREIGAVRSDVISEVRANGNVLGRLSLRVPRLIAANSRTGIKNAVSLGLPSPRLHFLPNVVDTDYFSRAERAANGTIKLIAVGRLVRQKRFDRFIDLIDSLNRAHGVRVKGLIVGAGEERDNLKRQAESLGLGEQELEFKGAVSDVRAVYREADILVLTSEWEGTPNVVLEAMSCGLPVVATRAGGIADIILQGKTGYLFDAEDSDSMTKKVADLSRSQELRRRLGDKARAHVQSSHALCRLPSYLSDLYNVVFL
jgi:glycosyltransferase involved in cell wall biosynthesis